MSKLELVNMASLLLCTRDLKNITPPTMWSTSFDIALTYDLIVQFF